VREKKNGFYRFVVRFALAVMRFMRWDVEVRGVHHLPATGPAILAANHVSFLDFIFIGAAADLRHRLVRFVSHIVAFRHPVSGPLMRGMRHIPVDRDKDPVHALRFAIEALRGGEVVGLHPEGRMNETFKLEGLKTGAARMAVETGAPLIPVAVWGGQVVWTKERRKLLQRGVQLQVVFGAPVVQRAGESVQDLTRRLGEAIERLIPQVASAAA
jgi:1-acyl-sn-glycerol-3-phosphate acyltransferase